MNLLNRRIALFGILISLTIINAQRIEAQPVLTLTEAIQEALSQNFSIQLAKNDEEIAGIENNWGNAGRLPTVNGAAGYNFSSTNLRQKLSNGTELKRDGASFQTENASVAAQWRLYNGGRVRAAKNRFEILELMSNLQVRQQANQVAYNVITAYVNVLRLKKQRAATEESIQLFEDRMLLAENRFTIGVAGKSDYLQALADLNLQKNLIIQIENNIAQSKAFLNNQLARNPDTPFSTADLEGEVTLPLRSGIMEAIDTLNPLLLLNKSQALVLIQQNKEINSLRLPIFNLNTGANLNNSNNSAGFFVQNTTFGPNVGLALNIPIFQGGIIKQQLKVNEVQQKSQDINYKIVRNDLLTSLVNAYNNYQNAQKQYSLEVSNLEVIKENSVIAMERFRKASITTVELRQTQLDLVQSQTRMINAQYEMKQAEADILLILGKLVE